MEIMDDYGIRDKVGYCMLNIASHNTTTLEELQALLISKLGAQVAIMGREEWLLRCFGHILKRHPFRSQGQKL